MASSQKASLPVLFSLVFVLGKTALTPAPAETPVPAGYFVAPDGLDTWSGRRPAPNTSRSDGPFRSLSAAVAAMRVLPLNHQIHIRAGAYALEAPVALGGADVGAQILAYPGEHPTLFGGLPVPDWHRTGNGLLTAAVPPLAASELPVLLADARPLRVARLPATDAADDEEAAWFFADRTRDGDDPHNSFRVRPENADVFRFAVPGALVSIFGRRGWQNYVMPIAHVDTAERLIALTGPTWDSIGEGSRFQILNAPPTSQAWRLDRGTNTVQLDASMTVPRPSVTVATLPCIFSIDHGAELTLAGLRLAGTSTEGAAICIAHSRGIKLDQMTIADVGDGIRLEHAAETNITNSEISHTAGFGITLRRGSDRNGVRGNWLHDIGWLHQDASAIWFDASSGNAFVQNRIERVAKFGIGGGSLNDGSAVDNLIESNEIQGANRRTSDGGAIMVIGWAQETSHDVIRGNFISGTTALGNMGWDGRPSTRFQDPVTKLVSQAIYLDDWASGVEVSGNLVCGNVGGIDLHAGWDNRVTGNMLLGNAGVAIGIDAQVWLGLGRHPHAMERNSVRQNVVMVERPSTGQTGAVAVRGGPAVVHFDHNVYFGSGLNGSSFHHERDVVGASYSFGIDAWQRRGQDLASSAGASVARISLSEGAIKAVGGPAPALALQIGSVGRPEDQSTLLDRIRKRCGVR